MSSTAKASTPAIRNVGLWLEQHLRTDWSSPALIPHLSGSHAPALVEEIIVAFERVDALEAPVKTRTLLALLALSPADRAASRIDQLLQRLLNQADRDSDEWVRTVSEMVRKGLFGTQSGSDRGAKKGGG